MFNKSKYTKWYFDIIKNAKTATRKRGDGNYYESHHIIPKIMKGKETVLLTAREHFVCHLLLQKMVTAKKDYYRMTLAITTMIKRAKTAVLYERIRIEHARTLSLMRKGKPKPPEFSIALKLAWARGKANGTRKSWNKGLTMTTDPRIKSVPRSEKNKMISSMTHKGKKRNKDEIERQRLLFKGCKRIYREDGTYYYKKLSNTTV